MSEKEKLTKLKENSNLMKLKKEINGIIGEILQEDESDIKDINNLMYAAATTMIQTTNQPSKRNKITRNEMF